MEHMEGHVILTGMTPDQERLRVWREYLNSYASVTRKLEQELRCSHDLSLAQYDVLAHLHGVACGRLRMGELAEALLFSTGGLSLLLDRMERDGLVTRERTPDDRRGVYAVITEAGCCRLREASETHLRGIQNHFAAMLQDDEIRPVGDFLARLRTQSNACSGL